jgi:hypothetical protein
LGYGFVKAHAVGDALECIRRRQVYLEELSETTTDEAAIVATSLAALYGERRQDRRRDTPSHGRKERLGDGEPTHRVWSDRAGPLA